MLHNLKSNDPFTYKLKFIFPLRTILAEKVKIIDLAQVGRDWEFWFRVFRFPLS